MICNAESSKNLIKAVLEQTESLDELGGFLGDEQQTQYVRDVRDIARKLQIAEQTIKKARLTKTYIDQLHGSSGRRG